MAKTIEQTVTFSGTPHDVYEILMDEKKHAQLVKDEARISREVGGAIDVYNGYITGENLEVVPDARVVQRWRASDWPEGQYSTATFEFEAVEGGTQMTFTQTDVPDEHYDGIAQGWQEHYWTEMETMLTAQ